MLVTIDVYIKIDMFSIIKYYYYFTDYFLPKLFSTKRAEYLENGIHKLYCKNTVKFISTG